ncbi:hypothetical protein [Ectopseudomonas oleovorans]|uniref:hypothetical protein n=1 Tax=Ectopseudomonas oleovorans TaxID=301 RepID=UPI000CF0A022|nr:hypothetical protein [Pseudomonas oleovorans]PPV41345.1 hypothetical protein C5L43_07380 [Pseudomonas oleovorans]
MSSSQELISIKEFQRRVWGENGTPLSRQSIRNHLLNCKLPGKQVVGNWYVDWNEYQAHNADDFVEKVLTGR